MFAAFQPHIPQKEVKIFKAGIGLLQGTDYIHSAKGCQELFGAGHFLSEHLAVFSMVESSMS